MQLELLEKVSNLLDSIDECINLEERYYLKELVLNNLSDDDLIIKAQEMIDTFEIEDEDRATAMEIVKTIYNLTHN